MNSQELGPDNAIWDDGEWIGWQSINSHLERLELKALYPNADVDLIPVFEELLSVAQHFHVATGKHLNIYGDIGELFGAIHFLESSCTGIMRRDLMAAWAKTSWKLKR